MKRPAAAFFIAAFAFAQSAAGARAQSNASPDPDATATPQACVVPAAISPSEALAHEIDDLRTLAFIESLATANAEARDADVRRASNVRGSFSTEAIADSPAQGCPQVEFAYRAARAHAIVEQRWGTRAARTVEQPLRSALAALEFPGSPAEDDRNAALAVFDTSVAKLDARAAVVQTPPKPDPRRKSYDPCNTDAVVTAPVEPAYPLSAKQMGVGGTFLAAVAVDVHGFVPAVHLRSVASPADGDALNDLANVSLLVAAESLYAPGFAQCKPVPGTYVYRNQFISR